MAQRLAVGTTIHGKVLGARLRRDIFFPEGGSALAQHASPVVADFLQHLLVAPIDEQRLQFVEAHIGRGDGRDVGIEHHALHDFAALLLVGHAVEDGKHIGELGDLAVHHAVLDGVEICLVLVAPESLLDPVAQLLGFYAIGAFVDAQKLGASSHRLHRLHEENLLEAQRAALVHGEVNPIDKNPVIGLSLGHTFAVEPSLYIVHQRHHARPHLTDKGHVGCIVIVVEDGLEPVEGIVHDGVDVSRDGVFSTQLADGALDTFSVETQVVVHEVRLDGVAAPGPAVALDAVHEELAGGEVHGVGGNVPDAVQQVVGTAEGAGAGEVVRGVFLIHEEVVVGGAGVGFGIDVAEGLGGRRGRASTYGKRKDVEGFAMVFVEGFLAALAVVDAEGALEVLYLQVAEGLAAEVVEGG